jgi:hypothetical protein
VLKEIQFLTVNHQLHGEQEINESTLAVHGDVNLGIRPVAYIEAALCTKYISAIFFP